MYMVMKSKERLTGSFWAPPISMGFGSDPAGATRSFAARICAERLASDGLTSITACTTASGLFQSTAAKQKAEGRRQKMKNSVTFIAPQSKSGRKKAEGERSKRHTSAFCFLPSDLPLDEEDGEKRDAALQ